MQDVLRGPILASIPFSIKKKVVKNLDKITLDGRRLGCWANDPAFDDLISVVFTTRIVFRLSYS